MEDISEKILEIFDILYPDWKDSKFILPETDLIKLQWIKMKIKEETNMMSREEIVLKEVKLRKERREILEIESSNFFMTSVKRSTRQTADACIELIRSILKLS